MTVPVYIPIALAVIAILLLVLIILMLTSRKDTTGSMESSVRYLSDSVSKSQQDIAGLQDRRLADMSAMQDKRLGDMSDAQDKRLFAMSNQITKMAMENEQKLDNIRTTMETRLSSLQEDNNKQLEQMRMTVDEKLQETLESRITKSFELVNTRLQEVYTGLGEMKDLASGVGDLKKVLSNVKTRGILGEVQLGAILAQILSPEQFEENVETVPESGKRVEFAVKLPGDGEGIVYLPIDSKFPLDAYIHLTEAMETADKDIVDAARKQLRSSVLSFAKDISEKYVQAPHTTDFGIMFLPTEGLYAELVNMGMVEELQSKYRINIAGPTTMAALLNSLQMGFRTLAIQKHSSEVWETLGAVKTEFENFGNVLNATQKKITQANSELEKLIGTRTNQIMRKLKSVERLDEADSRRILDVDGWDDLLPEDTHFDDE